MEDGSHKLGLQSFAPQPAALPGVGLSGARRTERSIKLGRDDAGSAATPGLICRLVADLPAPVASMEAALEMETAQAATAVVLPVAVALAEQAQCATKVASPALADSEARLAAVALSPEAEAWPEPELAVR